MIATPSGLVPTGILPTSVLVAMSRIEMLPLLLVMYASVGRGVTLLLGTETLLTCPAWFFAAIVQAMAVPFARPVMTMGEMGEVVVGIVTGIMAPQVTT